MNAYEINRIGYKAFRVYLRLLLGKRRRDAWLERFWVGAFDLPAFVPEVIRRHYRSKSWSALLPKWYDEPRVSEYMEGLRGELYVDVGASFGYYLRKLSSNFRRMIAIEADPTIFKFLQENAPPNCTPVYLAIAD